MCNFTDLTVHKIWMGENNFGLDDYSYFFSVYFKGTLSIPD